MATEQHFHDGPKTEHAQGDLIDKTEGQYASSTVDGDSREVGDAADRTREKAQEGKEHAGNIFQKTGGAFKDAVSETVHEVQTKLGKDEAPAKMPLED